MPENLYFQQTSTQKMLLDILFVFCKLNPDIGYRQGMHELLAPVLWVVERDAIDPTGLENADGSTEKMDKQLKFILNSEYIEHDTFIIFNIIMQNAKVFYETRPSSEVGYHKNLYQDRSQSAEVPIVARSNRIFYEYLPRFDPGLAAHFKSLTISPQIFLMYVTKTIIAFGNLLKIIGNGFVFFLDGSFHWMMSSLYGIYCLQRTLPWSL